MSRALTVMQSALLVVIGVAAAWLWVLLFGLWAAFDTPLVRFGLSLGLGVGAVASISLSLFALATAAAASLALRALYPKGFLAAALIFMAAFLAAFIVPAFFDSERIALLSSLGNLWVFVVFFALCVSLLMLVRHA